ncbi:hypothetical protein DYD21_16680 [Rhodohalobacter sp. SW132]|uniref:hypothetical protein n=1 Tax=Rhodohalobacter sp. SW132 TaxID=2293433 RepID=UPI000E223CE8|nr:hypothetical protein [Rhodohalobacter sp. SW132]REL24796.1 hypothetical protein DYD21_16680 [Rhodohalobacter sp. SW132]
MKKITLDVPDDKVDFVIELINQLGLTSSEEPDIPEEHKEIVRERIRSANQDDLVSWEEARKQLMFKSES